MSIERGSTWGKWDFHIHTPYSILHNNYGFNPEDDPNKFDNYVKNLFTKAIENKIVAIGITDYFSIDGYKRIKQDYLNNNIKMVELFPDEDLRRGISNILIFPNIELRLETFVGKDNHSVNYHVIFSNNVSITDIEECFLQQLKLTYAPNNTLPLTRNNIERIGYEYKFNNKHEKDSDYYVGYRQITVDYKQIIDLLERNKIFSGNYLISIPVDEDLSKIPWGGRDYQTRKILYQQCHFLMTSNSKTIEWSLAKGRENEQISEFGSIKPCIWGSDAHSYDQMFCPSENRFCWIKSNPTFEGLKQVLYEPEERVKIQTNHPEEKDEHQIIDRVVFKDQNFQTDPIHLSEGLTAIIGGKSTGKSIFLRHIAKGIDAKQVTEKEEKVSVTSSKLNVTADVIWKDGFSGERKIIYIPQSWLNCIVDENHGDSQLNNMIKTFLLQQDEIYKADKDLKIQIEDIIKKVKHDILDYVTAYEKVKECECTLRDFGQSTAFQTVIEKLKTEREELSAKSGITDEDFLKYSKLEKKITELTDTLKRINEEDSQVKSLPVPFVYLPQITAINSDGSQQYILTEVPTIKDMLTQAIRQINATIDNHWRIARQEIERFLSEQLSFRQNELTNLQTEYLPLKQLVSQNDQLKDLDIRLQQERTKLQKAQGTEDLMKEYIAKREELRKKILASRQELRQIYENYKNSINRFSIVNLTDSNIEFKAEVKDMKEDLFDAINSLFNNRNFRTFNESFHYCITNKDDLNIDDGLFEALWDAMIKDILTYKGGNTLQTSLERLFSDWYYIHYIIQSENDTINQMSPGKKALVLLEIIVNLEKSRCPILIDQPEDDLDNRSIYTGLVKYLKRNKHERQIIVVTHNANVVIGADAEEVIIANQDSKESRNHSKRFEYRCGAIENLSPLYDSDGTTVLSGILNQKGIQEQICDILEGGKIAFELRRKKYIKL